MADEAYSRNESSTLNSTYTLFYLPNRGSQFITTMKTIYAIMLSGMYMTYFIKIRPSESINTKSRLII